MQAQCTRSKGMEAAPLADGEKRERAVAAAPRQEEVAAMAIKGGEGRKRRFDGLPLPLLSFFLSPFLFLPFLLCSRVRCSIGGEGGRAVTEKGGGEA